MKNETINPGLALAGHLRKLRSDRGLTLQDLAAISQVSRATLSRIENGDVSPTAETLGRLASALALPISQLLTPLEAEFPPLIRRADQRLWTDTSHGFTRRAISPPGGQLKTEIIECTIEAQQRIAYNSPALPNHEHHLVLLSGTLTMTIDGIKYQLTAGDCLRYRLRGASVFETDTQPAHYILAIA